MTSWADASDDPALEQAPAEFTGGAGVRPRLQLKPRSKTAAAAQNSPAGGSSSIFGAAKPREAVLASKGIDASEVDKRVERKASVARLSAEQDKQVEALRAALTEVEEKLREANEMELPEEDYRVDAEKKRNDLNELIKGFQETNLKERNERTTSSKGGGGGDQQPDDAPAAGDSAAWGGLSTGGAPNGSKNEGRGGGGDGSQRKFERPSERRRRLEQQRGDHEGGGGGGGGYNNNHRGSRGGYNDYDNNEGGDDTFSSFGGNRNRGGRGGGGGGYHGGDRRGSDNRGSQRGGYNDRGGSYNDRGGSYNDDKYAGDRYNY